MYRIERWSPDVKRMSGCGFSIKLYPEFKKAVLKSKMNQENVDCAMQTMAPQWLEDHRFLPEMNGIKVHWGEWGPEHITIPGNACGLDMSYQHERNGVQCLIPHNVDTLEQASLILTVFLYLESYIFGSTNKKP